MCIRDRGQAFRIHIRTQVRQPLRQRPQLAVVLPRKLAARVEGHRLVEDLMLLPVSAFDGRDDLPVDAELREGPEGRVSVLVIVTDRLKDCLLYTSTT